jgi:aspartyl-tRNA(Asn)/glutamyl-tRNA(Gln) amidotransferase subunit A
VLAIETFARGWRAGELTAVDATDACLRRIAEDSDLNAFIHVDAEGARAQAAAADRERADGHDRGPLQGVSIAIKDLVDIEGQRTTAASKVREGHVARTDGEVITHLRRAGAVLIGKTNLHEFAYGTTSEESAFGAVRNPLDETRTPGGSSGGSAVAVATGMALGALGTDTGGSIRIPAACCGIVGLKPTYGEISASGVVPLSRSLDHVGPLARTVTDAWLLYRGFLGASDALPLEPAPLSGMRLGVARPFFCDLMDPGVRARFEAALVALGTAGVRLEDVAIPHAPLTAAVYIHIHASEGSEYHARMLEKAAERYTPMVRRRLEMGRYILSEDYIRAQNARAVLRRDVDAALGDRHALILPTMPIPAPLVGAETVSVGGREELVRAMMLRCTQLFNVTGHPAVALPGGDTPEGLPSSLQLVGRRHGTDDLMSVALAVEGRLAL